MADNILEVRNLKKYFKTHKGQVHAVDDVSFTLERGRTLGVVGESGCGKSTLGRVILQLIKPTSGSVLFNGKEVTGLKGGDLRRMRKDMQMIFQDPFSSIDPRRTVCQIIGEPLTVHGIVKNRAEREERVLELMKTVGLAERLINAYPHELDGGRRQRVGIACALAVEPGFIVCDEPVSALDVSIQAQILNLLKEMQRKRGLSYMFITHDLSVVNHFSDDIAVMYLGQIVEMTTAEALFDHPTHPYTQALLSAIPIPEVGAQRQRIILNGEISSPIDPPDACRFAKRCLYATDQCRQKCPSLTEVRPGHRVACWRANEF
ncbi:MAG: ATP-binding cassette domain-containing protein [Clostridia bacterium]|nr:ATP-binding cassette domain-containing protein [Clostridia bacterium]